MKKYLLLAALYLDKHPKVKDELMKILDDVDKVAKIVAAHIENVEKYFENHPTVDEFHSTANGQVFYKENDAVAHAATLEVNTVISVHRDDLAAPVEDTEGDQPEVQTQPEQPAATTNDTTLPAGEAAAAISTNPETTADNSAPITPDGGAKKSRKAQ